MILLFLSCNEPKKEASNNTFDTAVEEQWIRDPMFNNLANTLEYEFISLGAEGAAFALFNSTEIVYAEGFGEEPDGRKIAPETNFRIGSVTKMLTAVAMLQELDDNSLSVEANFTSINPTFSITATADLSEDISFRDLLQHSTGIVDAITIDGSTADSALNDFVNTTLVDTYYQMNPAGLFHNYANPNYMMAGYVAESLSGKPYTEKIRDDVLLPISMNRSTFDALEIIQDGDFATGLSNGSNGYDEDEWLEPTAYDNGSSRPAGYLWSNVVDMAALGMFFMQGDDSVLSNGLREEMMSPQISTNVLGGYSNYGFGWFVESGFWTSTGYIETEYLHHSGAIPGYSTTVLIWPEKDIGLVALAATDGAYISTSLFEALSLYGLPAESDFPDDIYFDDADMESYNGHYMDPFNIGEVTITHDNGTLQVDAPTLDDYDVPYATTLTPYTKDSVFWDVQGYPFLMSFIRDEMGIPQYFAGRYFVASRSADDGVSKSTKVSIRPKIVAPTREPVFNRPPLR